MPAQPELTVQERDVPGPGGALFVRAVGGCDGGPALVLLHGGPGVSHEYMQPLEALASHALRVVSYDQRGVGRSGSAATADPMQGYVEDLEAVRQAIGAERIHVLGHSAGGWPAMGYAAAYPEQVASVIFVDSVPPTGAQLYLGFAYSDTVEAQVRAMGLIPEPLPDDPTEQLNALLPAYFADPRHAKASQGLNGARVYPTTIMPSLGDYDLRPLLARITMPALSFISKVPFGQAFAGELADELPQGNSRRILMEHCGHFPWLECPDWFFREVRTFLAPHLDPSPGTD
jgi:pimeloyl-ACP methyl ester carboxylesterase